MFTSRPATSCSRPGTPGRNNRRHPEVPSPSPGDGTCRLPLMPSYLLRRVFSILVTLLVVGVVVFFIIRLVPGDVTSALLGQDATPDQVATLRESLELDRAVPLQFAAWFGNV